MSVTIINAGTQHNVVPDTCIFTIDVRATDQYTLEEIIEVIQENIQSEVTARSIRLRPSSIPMDHPIVQAGLKLGQNCLWFANYFGSGIAGLSIFENGSGTF